MTVDQIFWLGAFVVFLAIATGTLGLVSVWFAAGALVSLLVAWLAGMVWLQVLVFLVVSCVTLASLRPLAKKYIAPKIMPTNADRLIGTVAVLCGDVDNIAAKGEVILGGIPWSARSTNGEPIPAGTTVRVDRMEGVRVYVTPVEVESEATSVK